MLSPEEHSSVLNDADVFYQNFTDEDLENAEFYHIEYDPIEEHTALTLYDSESHMIRTVYVEDYDVAVVMLEIEWGLESLDDPEVSGSKAKTEFR